MIGIILNILLLIALVFLFCYRREECWPCKKVELLREKIMGLFNRRLK